MLPIKKIVCPTDFSEASSAGVKIAAELAQQFSAKLFLVHVLSAEPSIAISSPRTTIPIPALMKELEASAQNAFEQLLKEKYLQDIESQTMVIQGKRAEEIVGVCAREKADVIVIATHGESGWRKFLFGSVCEKVIRLAECPVLSIPEPN